MANILGAGLKAVLPTVVKEAAPIAGKELLEQGTEVAGKQVIEEVAGTAPKITKPISLDEYFHSRVTDDGFYSEAPPAYKRHVQNIVNTHPEQGPVIATAIKTKDYGVVDNLTRASFIEIRANEATDAGRAIASAAEGRVLPGPKDDFAPTISDDLNYLEKGVDYTDELAQWEKNRARAERDMAKADAKNANYSEDLLNRITTIAGLPGQVKKWLKKAAEKAKAGIPFEEGDPIFDEMGEFIGSSIEGMTFQELHHELMKAVYSAYVDTAAKLAKSGSGNTMDILNLNHMANSYGFGMGDFGVEGIPRVAHSWGHNELIKEGVQKSGDALKAQVKAITEQPNMQALTQDFKRSLEEFAIPMRRKMDLGKRAYFKLPEIDRLKVHQLKSAKDNLKNDLKQLMIGEFQQAGLPIPSSGGGVDFFKAFKKSGGKPSQEAIELDKAIKLTRKETQALNEKLKTAIGPIVEKDVEIDVETMEKYIDAQMDLGSDISPREAELMRGSFNKANESGGGVDFLTGDEYGW